MENKAAVNIAKLAIKTREMEKKQKMRQELINKILMVLKKFQYMGLMMIMEML